MRTQTSKLVSVSPWPLMSLLLAMACCVVFPALTQAQSATHVFPVTGRSGTAWVDTGLDIEPNTLLHISAIGKVDVGSGWGVHGPLGSTTRFAPGRGYPSIDVLSRYGLLARLTSRFPDGRVSATESVLATWPYNETDGYFSAPRGGHLWLTVNDDYIDDNTGAFKVYLETTTFPPPEILCRPCPLDEITLKRVIGKPLPNPKTLQTFMVLDGEIIAVNQSAELILITVSQGSALEKYGDLPNLKIVFAKDAARSGSSLSNQGVVQGLVFQNDKMSLITGASRLKLSSNANFTESKLNSKQAMPD